MPDVTRPQDSRRKRPAPGGPVPGGEDLTPSDVAPHRSRATFGWVLVAVVIVVAAVLIVVFAGRAPDLSDGAPEAEIVGEDAVVIVPED
ncbi:hypothetical protein [Jannaschia rubra]|uniref:Uncharacterized protein n=1 Tax=Jannaschia rubra TaxID=282197 RepID=A0A0M6XSM2_9RHOB|nr:hypothetical protein [Jannaschia rubra]CTQ33607.1 hypothetical protein JAN5088_02390 [Jannaschia rubra]SFG04811.1 hypothetical protein SAMN04488517_102436 [Jannaschia rubra]